MGANDVANNFGTSVGSKSVSLKQALVIAAVFELVGSVGLGAAVTDSVRKGVYKDEVMADDPAAAEYLIIANLTVLLIVTGWLFASSFLRMSVSTTHSIIGAYMGCGLSISPKVVNWKYLLNILASWFVAPAVSFVLASLIFLSIRKWILRANQPVVIADRFLPLFLYYVCVVIALFFTFSNPINTCTKKQRLEQGNHHRRVCDLSTYARQHLWQSVLVALLAALALSLILYFPMKRWIKRRLKEAQLRKLQPQHILRQHSLQAEQDQDLAESPSGKKASNASLESKGKARGKVAGPNRHAEGDHDEDDDDDRFPPQPMVIERALSDPAPRWAFSSSDELSLTIRTDESVASSEGGSDEETANLPAEETVPKCGFTSLWNRDLHAEVAKDVKVSEFDRLSERFDEKADAYFKALQVCSAALACLVHGSNDVGNAAAPFASIYSIYREGRYEKEMDVPIWVLLLGGSSISIGLMLLGHKVIRTIGIELVHMNAPKGFSVEMAIFTIIIVCSFLGFTVSSTHVGVAAMIAVGLMDRYIDPVSGKDVTETRWLNTKAVNWRIASKLCLSWINTIIICGTAAYLISSYAFRSPHIS